MLRAWVSRINLYKCIFKVNLRLERLNAINNPWRITLRIKRKFNASSSTYGLAFSQIKVMSILVWMLDEYRNKTIEICQLFRKDMSFSIMRQHCNSG